MNRAVHGAGIPDGGGGLTETRLAFLGAAGEARTVLASSAVWERWSQPSALRELSVAGLAGHMVGATVRVEEYLDGPIPADELPLSAAGYYSRVVDTDDISAPLHVGIRERGEALGREGHGRLVERLDRTVDRLKHRFAEEPPERLLTVFGDHVMELDQYLLTRIVELCVHTDDLCASVGTETPTLSSAAMAIETLIEVARFRHGELAVLRALSRRERDHVNALRVF